MTKWIVLGALVVGVLPLARGEQNPPQTPTPPQSTGPQFGPPPGQMGDSHRSSRGEMRSFMMHYGGPGESSRILPPGAWWNDPDLAKRIELSSDQQKRIEDIFLQSKISLIHMHASLDEEELLLGPLLDANPVDQGKTLAQISKIADTRADLEKANAKMLLQIRGVLSQAQWTKLQQERGGPMRPHGMPGPDGMHGMGLSSPDLRRLQEQLRAMPPVDTAKIQSQLQAALKDMPQIDLSRIDVPQMDTQALQDRLKAVPDLDTAQMRANMARLQSQLRAAMQNMPKVDTEALRAQVDAALKSMPNAWPEVNLDSLRNQLQAIPPLPSMPPLRTEPPNETQQPH